MEKDHCLRTTASTTRNSSMALFGCQRRAKIPVHCAHMKIKGSARRRFWRWFYDRTAFAYDATLRLADGLRVGSEERVRSQVIARLELAASARVLELGCGTASNRAYLAGPVDYIGLDISIGMLRRAQAKCKGLQLPASFVQADAQALPFQAEAGDLVVAMGALQHLAEPANAIRGMRRVVKRGGRVLVIDERRAQARVLRGEKHDNVLLSTLGEYFIAEFQN